MVPDRKAVAMGTATAAYRPRSAFWQQVQLGFRAGCKPSGPLSRAAQTQDRERAGGRFCVTILLAPQGRALGRPLAVLQRRNNGLSRAASERDVLAGACVPTSEPHRCSSSSSSLSRNCRASLDAEQAAPWHPPRQHRPQGRGGRAPEIDARDAGARLWRGRGAVPWNPGVRAIDETLSGCPWRRTRAVARLSRSERGRG